MEKSHTGKDGLQYINCHIIRGDEDTVLDMLIRTGANVTVCYGGDLGLREEDMKEPDMVAEIGMSSVPVYKIPIDRFIIGETIEIEGMKEIYVSFSEYFRETPTMGCDAIMKNSMIQPVMSEMELYPNTPEGQKEFEERNRELEKRYDI